MLKCMHICKTYFFFLLVCVSGGATNTHTHTRTHTVGLVQIVSWRRVSNTRHRALLRHFLFYFIRVSRGRYNLKNCCCVVSTMTEKRRKKKEIKFAMA